MDINTLFAEMAQYKSIIAEATAEYEKCEALIKEQMVASGIDTLIGNEHKATYKEIVSHRFDSTAFRRDHADMYESYKKQSSTMRFTFA